MYLYDPGVAHMISHHRGPEFRSSYALMRHRMKDRAGLMEQDLIAQVLYLDARAPTASWHSYLSIL